MPINVEQILIDEGIKQSSSLVKYILSDYFGLTSYFGVSWKKIRGKEKEYHSVGKLWNDILGPAGLANLSQPTVLPNDVITLHNSYITEWGPISPGKMSLASTVNSLTYKGKVVEKKLKEIKKSAESGKGFIVRWWTGSSSSD